MFLKREIVMPDSQTVRRCIFVLLFFAAIALRVAVYHVETSDYTFFVSQWYAFIKTHNGFAAFKYDFYNYNPPYLYLLALATYVPVPQIIAIKSLSVLFDVVLSIFTYLVLNLKYKRSYVSIIGALVVLFAPTIFINGALWGQCDAIYTAFCLGSLYFLLKERPAWACAFFAIAISFKLQAIFFLPVLLVILLKRKLPVRYLVFIPVIFLLSLAPAFIAGRDAVSLLSIYEGQITTGGVGGGGQFSGAARPFSGGGGGVGQVNRAGRRGNFNGGGARQASRGNFNGRGAQGGNLSSSSLTLNAPTFYQWLPASAPGYWKWIGILLAGMVVIVVSILVLGSKEQLLPAIQLKIALVFVLAIPFLLPEMHERYFYLADVISIAYAFYFPRAFYIAVIMQLCSLLSYAPYLLGRPIISLGLVAFALLVITVISLIDLVLTLYPHIRKRVGKLEAFGAKPSPETANSIV